MDDITIEAKFIEFTVTLDTDDKGACWSAEGSDGSEYFGRGHNLEDIKEQLEDLIPDWEEEIWVKSQKYTAKYWGERWEAVSESGDEYSGEGSAMDGILEQIHGERGDAQYKLSRED